MSFALFATAIGVAGAQRGDSGPGPVGPRPQRGDGPPMPPMADAFVSDLASNLGVTEDFLRAAMTKTHEDMRPMMQERFGDMRDRMQERFGRGDDGQRRPGEGPMLGRGDDRRGPGSGPAFGRPPMGPRGQAMHEMHGQMMGAIATSLNMSPDELRQQLESGQTVSDIARARGMDPDALANQLASAMIKEHEGHLNDMIRRAMDRSFARGPAQDR